MNQNIITDETKLKLLNTVENRIEETTKEVDTLRNVYNYIDSLIKLATENNLQLDIDSYKSLVEYRLFIGVLILDLSTSTRVYLTAKFKYEEIFAARQIIVIINEGFKKIYNFVNETKSGIERTKNRNNSFWVKNIGEIIDFQLSPLKEDYNLITNVLDDYLKENFFDIKEQRDISIHYDQNSIKVYDTLIKIDLEKTFKILSPFLDILNAMFDFTDKIIQAFQSKNEQEILQTETRLNGLLSSLDDFKNEKTAEIINEFQNRIMHLFNSLKS